MCILRCPTFGGRVSVAAKAGVKEVVGLREDGTPGAMTGAFDIHKDSLDPDFARELTEKGVVVVPLPKDEADSARHRAAQAQDLPAVRAPGLRRQPGHRRQRLRQGAYQLRAPARAATHPRLRARPRGRRLWARGVGNSIRYLAMAPRDDALRVEGVANLLCAGEKAGLFVGHTEAAVTGSLAGHNAVRLAAGLEPLELPDSTVLGDIISLRARPAWPPTRACAPGTRSLAL